MGVFKMKRISSLFLAAWMCVAIVGCSEDAGTEGPALETPATESSETSEAGSDKKEESSEESSEEETE
jgi:hypothetical protein